VEGSADERAGRRRSAVTLIAVTKKFPASVTLEAYALGLRHFGENYVQEFEAKHSDLASITGPGADAVFHLIGHLQSNKTRIAGELFQVIETVDSEKLAAYTPSAPIPDQAATSEATSAAVRSLFAVVERYPDIKAGANVQDLQDEIERLEGMIADRRELYNDQVYRYNTRITQVPGALLAPLFGWRPRDFFAVDAADAVRPDTDLRSG